MKPEPAPVPADIDDILPDHCFADAFSIAAPEHSLDIPAATRLIFSRQPGWVSALIRIRDALVAPFGLKGTRHARPGASIGGFPVVSETVERVVLGFDDQHLDFRIVVQGNGQTDERRGLLAATLVRPHNLAGRAYLRMVLPFHRRIVPQMLCRLHKRET